MRLSTALEQFIEESRRRPLSPETIRKYKHVLEDFVAWATTQHSNNVVAFDATVTRAFDKALLNKGLAATTVGPYRAAIAEFAKWCLARRLIDIDPMRELPEIRRPELLPRPYGHDALAAILALPLEQPDLMLRTLLYEAGLRVAEVSHLTVRQVDFGGGEEHGELRIVGKGRKVRIVPMTRPLWHALRDYMLAHSDLTNLDAWVVAQLHGKGRGHRFTENMIQARARQWGKVAGVDQVTPHRFRHSFATNLYGKTGDIRLVQEALGHRDLRTTQRYAAVSPERLREAIMGRRASVPGGDSQREIPKREQAP